MTVKNDVEKLSAWYDRFRPEVKVIRVNCAR